MKHNRTSQQSGYRSRSYDTDKRLAPFLPILCMTDTTLTNPNGNVHATPSAVAVSIASRVRRVALIDKFTSRGHETTIYAANMWNCTGPTIVCMTPPSRNMYSFPGTLSTDPRFNACAMPTLPPGTTTLAQKSNTKGHIDVGDKEWLGQSNNKVDCTGIIER